MNLVDSVFVRKSFDDLLLGDFQELLISKLAQLLNIRDLSVQHRF